MGVEKDILTSVGETNVLYGIHAMTYNMHILLHMVRSSQKCGPIKSTSAFPFENGILTCKHLVKGSKNVASEMAAKWLRKCSLNESISNFSMSETCTSYCENLIARKNLTSEQTRRAENNTVLIIGKGKIKDKVTRIMRLTLCDETLTPLVYDRCIYMQSRFYSAEYTRADKRNDTVVLLHSGEVVEIRSFAVVNDLCYVLGYRFLTRPVIDPIHLLYMHEVMNTTKSTKLFRIAEIKEKLLLIKVGTDVKYSCRLPNTVEIQ